MYEITYLPRGGSLPYIERQAIDVEYGELTTRWSHSHVRSPPLAEAATPPEVVAQFGIWGEPPWTQCVVRGGVESWWWVVGGA